MSSDSSPVVSSNQMRGQDHVTSHVISDEDNVTSEEDHVTFDKDHVTAEDHKIVDKDHTLTSDKNYVISDKNEDHVAAEQDHVTSVKDHVDMAKRLDYTSTDNTAISHDKKDKSPIHHGDVTDGGSNYDATKELDEILSKCDLVDGSHLSTDHSIGVTDTIKTRPPQKAVHEQPQQSSIVHKKSNSLEVPLASTAGNKSSSPGAMSDSVRVCCVVCVFVCSVCLCVWCVCM